MNHLRSYHFASHHFASFHLRGQPVVAAQPEREVIGSQPRGSNPLPRWARRRKPVVIVQGDDDDAVALSTALLFRDR